MKYELQDTTEVSQSYLISVAIMRNLKNTLCHFTPAQSTVTELGQHHLLGSFFHCNKYQSAEQSNRKEVEDTSINLLHCLGFSL